MVSAVARTGLAILTTLLVLWLSGCAAAAAPHDAGWGQRTIDEAQCRTWARAQAQADYGPQLWEATQQRLAERL